MNIPKGKSEFEKIRREGLYYVDKTGLIGEILKSSGTQVTLITRPRRFGKTLGMSTLECFLDIQKIAKVCLRDWKFQSKGYLRCVDEPVACDELES